MPNLLDAEGLQTATREELIEYFTEQYQLIYGTDISLDSDTPDGQFMNILVQQVLDLQDLLVQIYNSFDPDLAIGAVLSQRVAINGIQRQAGTYTITNITLVNSGSVNLYGLDQDEEPVYTISDNDGNEWYLSETELGLSPGSHVLVFRAAIPGAELTIPNTITIQRTIVLGVTSVNNPTSYTSLGTNEESDAILRVRRQQSVSLVSQGYLAGLYAALESISGMTSVNIHENFTNSTDSTGTPGHTIWVIVAGVAAAAEIAEAIYSKRNAGCGMRGDETYAIEQVDGTEFTVQWDEVEFETLFMLLTITSINTDVLPDINAIREGLPTLLDPGIFDTVDINQISTYAQEIDPNALVTPAFVSNGSIQFYEIDGIPAAGAVTFGYDGDTSSSLPYNASQSDIQTALRTLTGNAGLTVTGTFIGQSLEINMVSANINVYFPIIIVANTLSSALPADLNFSWSIAQQAKVSPQSRRNEFVVSPENIIIVQMQLIPPSSSATDGTEIDFVAYGGYGTYTFSLETNASGASIDASTGEYVAGGTPGTDVVKVIDQIGNSITANVIVV